MNTHYTKKSFEGCLFNPMNDERMVDAYPVISEIIDPEWSSDPWLDSIIRYTVMIYDPKSALVMGERDLNYRKGIGAELAGFDVQDEEAMSSIYGCTYPILVDYTVKYLMRFVKSKEWAALVAIEFKLWEEIKQTMTPISGKSSKEELEAVQKKAVIAQEIDNDIARLENYYKRFFGEDDELERKAKRRMTPELMAEKK